MHCVVELLDVESVALKLNNSSFVVVHIAVVWRRKYCNNTGKLSRTVPFVHFVAVKLSFVSS